MYQFLSISRQYSLPSGVADQSKAWAKIYSASPASHSAASRAVEWLWLRNALSKASSHPILPKNERNSWYVGDVSPIGLPP